MLRSFYKVDLDNITKLGQPMFDSPLYVKLKALSSSTDRIRTSQVDESDTGI